MKICCLSDLHGNLIDVPDCDLLLLGGDYCPTSCHEFWWYNNTFAPWIEKLSKRMKIIGVAGNHDWPFEETPELIPKMEWTYLQDSGTEWNDLKFWGSPLQKRFFDWAFNADEPELKRRWSFIPDNTDVIVLHGPPLGYGDFSYYGESGDRLVEPIHVGSPSLLERIQEIKPKLVIYGHIHSGYGKYQEGTSILVNASLVNEKYKVANEPIIIEI